jgi:hypothetical protein
LAELHAVQLPVGNIKAAVKQPETQTPLFNTAKTAKTTVAIHERAVWAND